MSDVENTQGITEQDLFGSDASDNIEGVDLLAGLFGSSAEAEEVVPTTDETEPATENTDEQSGEADAATDGAADETETAAEPENSRLKFTARVDHADKDVEIDSKDLPGIWQKAQNMDRVAAKNDTLSKENATYKSQQAELATLARTMGFDGATDAEVTANMLKSMTEQTKNTQIDAMVKQGTARDVAEYIVNQKMKDAASTSEAQSEVTENKDNESTTDSVQKDFERLFTYRPELREKLRTDPNAIPKELLIQADKTGDLTGLYLDWESKQNTAKASKQKQENKVLKQNAASAKKAVVKGVSGQGTVNQQEDPMLRGLFGRS